MVSNIAIFDLNNLKDVILTWGNDEIWNPLSKDIFVEMLKYNVDIFRYNIPDPVPGCLKEFCLEMPSRSVKYRFSENCGRIQNVSYTEHMNIMIGGNGNMFTPYVFKICSDIKFLQIPIPFDIDFNGRNCSVLHLRNELDALVSWSIQNKMSVIHFEKSLNQKYIDLVEKYISKENNILLVLTSRRINNPVIEYLEKTGYWILFNIYENIGRERMAISDLVYASNLCNSILISSGGSTYSVLLDARLQHNIHISFNINNIHEQEKCIEKINNL
jgi:hypothetical protein